MNLTALEKMLIVFLLTALSLPTIANAQSDNKYLATFPGGVVFLPTVNANNVIVRYHNVLGGYKDAVFYPRGDTLLIQRLDTCQREYIALSWAYDALERRYIDSTFSAKQKAEQTEEDNKKQVGKTKVKYFFRGGLWGIAGGIVLGVLAFVR